MVIEEVIDNYLHLLGQEEITVKLARFQNQNLLSTEKVLRSPNAPSL